jgi:Ca2+-binding RTX toxin-like protein
MSTFGANFALSLMTSEDGLKVIGNSPGASAGGAVSAAGDVNGDGFADVIVGARSASPNGDRSGAACVVFGASEGLGGTLIFSQLNGSNGFQISGEATDDYAGYSVSTVGDVNGDGFADIIVEAPGAGLNGQYAGAAYVIFGRAGEFEANLNLSSLDGTNGFQISGAAEFDSLEIVSAAGDVNGDGLADVILKAPEANANGSDSGAVYVVFGRSGGFAADLNVGSLDGTNGYRISGEAAGDNAGWSVSVGGDFNGDGYDDIILGAPYADPNSRTDGGTAYVVFGKAAGFGSNLNLAALNGKNGFQINGEGRLDNASWSVALTSDVNGDGFDDIIVGAPYGDEKFKTDCGAAYVIFGKAGGFDANLNLSALNGKNGFQIIGEEAYDYVGFSISAMGDVNGDGLADICVEAREADPNGRRNAGASYIIFGKEGGQGANLNLADLNGKNGFQISGESEFDYATDVSVAGDINGDGIDDLIIGAPFADPRGSTSGAAYVVFGKKGFFPSEIDLRDLDGRNGFQITGAAKYDEAGTSVSAAGDVNGDGYDDILVGAHGTDLTDYDEGTAYIIFGKQTVATSGRDKLTGTNGHETISGMAGDDVLIGRGGNDRLEAGTGTDTLIGGRGNDTYVIDGGDTIIENTGEGTDTVEIQFTYTLGADLEDLVLTGSRAVSGTGNVLANSITGNAANNRLSGMGGSDRLAGVSGSDLLDGGQGNDRLDGGVGADSLFGGAGRDTLDGGPGADRLTGGEGKDVFVFDDRIVAGKTDRITDFNVVDDTIYINNDTFYSPFLNFGALKAAAFASNTTGNAADGTDRLIYETDTGKVWFDRDGTGPATRIHVMTLDRNVRLTEADFFVI